MTRLDCVTLGVMVNKAGERYYDEGEDFWGLRYAIWGRLVAQQQDQISYCFVDSKTIDRFMPSRYPAVEGNTIGEVARQFGLAGREGRSDHRGVQSTRCSPEPSTTPSSTTARQRALTPTKTHWAQRLDTPPFYGYPLRPGLTFTYFAVKVDKPAAVMMKSGKPAENIFAAGESHGRQHPSQRLYRRYRVGDRQRFRTNRGESGGQGRARKVAASLEGGSLCRKVN